MKNLILDKNCKVAVIGAGAMGSGIAQVAATAGHQVLLFDTRAEAVDKAIVTLSSTLDKLVEKQKISLEKSVQIKNNILPAYKLEELKNSNIVVEAIIESLIVKQELFKNLETIVSNDTILASNTSSLSVTAIAAACKLPNRVIGLHFFNPAPLMPLVEIIPAVQTEDNLPLILNQLMKDWNKIPVLAKDTPGFIVNRVARPFYSESLRICEEGIADLVTIDWALKEFGGFKMGPFELMDLIGNDINYTVTETVWTQCYYDPRYRPSIIQKKMVESNRLGRKMGRGYYNYAEGTIKVEPTKDAVLGKVIMERVLAMLINEAADAVYYQIASKEDIELAMTKGVNYPKGLLSWADEIGIDVIVHKLNNLYETYQEDRYRSSVLLKQMTKNKFNFF